MKAFQGDATVQVKNPKTGKLYSKRVVAVGGKRVLDILTDAILDAAENAVVSRVRFREPWILRAEESDLKIKQTVFQKKKTRNLRPDDPAEAADPGSSPTLKTAPVLADNEAEVPAEEQALILKMQELLERNTALRKFLQSKFDPSDFRAELPGWLMKSLIFETAKFNHKKDSQDLCRQLAAARAELHLSESFLLNFSHDRLKE